MYAHAKETQVAAAHQQGGISAFELPHVGYVMAEVTPGLTWGRSIDGTVEIVIMGGVSEKGEDGREMWLVAKNSKPLPKAVRVFEAVLK